MPAVPRPTAPRTRQWCGRALFVVRGLPVVAACEDVETLAKRKLQVPEDPQMRSKVEAIPC